MNYNCAILNPTEAFLIASVLHTQWTKRSLYAEYKAIMDKLIGIGPIVVKVYYPKPPCLNPDYCGTADADTICENCSLPERMEVKTFQSVSDMLDWKATIPYSSTRIMPDGAIAVTVRNE